MVAKFLAIDALGAHTIDFPRLAQFAGGAGVAGAFAFVMHVDLFFFDQAIGGIGVTVSFKPKRRAAPLRSPASDFPRRSAFGKPSATAVIE